MRPTIRFVDETLITTILAEAKRILAEVGVEIMGSTLRQRLQDHGLRLDAAGERLLFPADVVDAALAAAPAAFTLYDRAGQPHATLGGDRVHFVPGSSGVNVLDHRTGEHRAATTADYVDYVRLADGLEHIAYLATAFSTHDVEPQISDAWRLFLTLTHSLKPVVSGAFTEHGTPRMAELMQCFRHDRADLIARPLSIFTITPTGLFRYSEESCQNLLDCVALGIPIEVVPVTLMGLIAPVTPLGATVMHVADVLSGLTMAQLLQPGTPVLFGGAPATFHMKAASSPMSAVEAWQVDAAYLAVAKSLRLPTQSYLALSEGKFLDAQAGSETFGSALLAALAAVNSVSGPGMLDYVLTFSLEKLVFDNELCGQALFFVRDVQPREDVPTVDLVRQLLEEKHLLTNAHTLKYWKSDMYFPSAVIDRTNRDTWLKAGAATLQQRVRAELDRRLAAYRPVMTDPRAVAEMLRIIRTGMTEPNLPEIQLPA